MPDTVTATAEAAIAANPERVVALLTDYRAGRPRLLTPHYTEWSVEEGGEGVGTVFRYRFKAGPRERVYRMRCEAAGAGAVVERDLESSLTTRWRIEAAGPGSRVGIETSWNGAGGVGGFFERTFAPRALGRVYAEQLERLAGALGTAG